METEAQQKPTRHPALAGCVDMSRSARITSGSRHHKKNNITRGAPYSGGPRHLQNTNTKKIGIPQYWSSTHRSFKSTIMRLFDHTGFYLPSVRLHGPLGPPLIPVEESTQWVAQRHLVPVGKRPMPIGILEPTGSLK